MVTPVSSPTPDEQAAGLTSLRCKFCGWVDSHDPACMWTGPRRPEDFTAVPPPPPTAAELTAQVADLRASLVVVREQLTQAQDRIDATVALHVHGPLGDGGREVCDVCTNEAGTWEDWPCPTVLALTAGTPTGPTEDVTR